MKNIIKCTAIAFFALMLVALGAPANATGSDGATPYTVDTAGVTLPGSDTFKPNGHVNIKYLTESGAEKSKGIHFDPNNNQPGGKWIGRNFIPWDAFGSDIKCVTWVQVHGYNQHFGEGGQKPVCLSKPSTPPPNKKDTDSKYTGVNCDDRVMNFVKRERSGIFDYDYHQAKWVFTGWSSWEVIKDSEFIKNMTPEQVKAKCPELPEVGSMVNPWTIGLGTLLALGGGALLLRSRAVHSD